MKRARHCGISSVKATKDGIFSSSPTQIRRRKSWHGRNEGDTAPSAKSNEKGRFGINTEPPFCAPINTRKKCASALNSIARKGQGSVPWSPSINTRKKYESALNSIAKWVSRGSKTLRGCRAAPCRSPEAAPLVVVGRGKAPRFPLYPKIFSIAAFSSSVSGTCFRTVSTF